jgi:hypothetical protein
MNSWTPVHGFLLWSCVQPPVNSKKKLHYVGFRQSRDMHHTILGTIFQFLLQALARKLVLIRTVWNWNKRNFGGSACTSVHRLMRPRTAREEMWNSPTAQYRLTTPPGQAALLLCQQTFLLRVWSPVHTDQKRIALKGTAFINRVLFLLFSGHDAHISRHIAENKSPLTEELIPIALYTNITPL